MVIFAVRYESGKTGVVEREVAELGHRQLNEWFAISRDAYELWTASMDEAIKVARTMCHAVRQEFSGLTVHELWGYREAYYRELDKHSFRLERQRFLEVLECIEEELRDKLDAIEYIELSHGWRLCLAKRYLTAKELTATGYEPDSFLVSKQLQPIQPTT